MTVRILFLCTGNSCRSIIAEALANHLGAGRLAALSAGSQPTGTVNPNALAVLARHDVPAGDALSQSWEAFDGQPFDVVITVCDNAAGESCPIWLGPTPKVHWGVADPAHVTGSEDQIRAAFEQTFNEMQARINAMLALPLETLDATALKTALQAIPEQLER